MLNMILIFSINNELSTTQVIKQLNLMGEEVVRINSDDNSTKFKSISKDAITFTSNNKEITLLEAKSCWWRRTGLSPINFTKNEKRESFYTQDIDLSSLLIGSKSIINQESKGLIEYIFTRVYKNCQINLGTPKFELNKLLTLELAQSIGINTPRFDIISNTNQINYDNYRIINKPIVEGIYDIIENYSFYSYTEEITKKLKTNIEIFPSLIMELIQKYIEIRTFYINGEFFSMAIFSQESKQTTIDFRKYNQKKPNRNEPFKLPVVIENKLQLLFEKLNLNTGSVDLILDKKGIYYFLEINPVGQYDMVSQPCNYDLDFKIANYLKYGQTT